MKYIHYYTPLSDAMTQTQDAVSEKYPHSPPLFAPTLLFILSPKCPPQGNPRKITSDSLDLIRNMRNINHKFKSPKQEKY